MTRPGKAHPVGARVDDGGVNFSVFSEHADAVELLLFDRPTDAEPSAVVPLLRDTHFWHAFVPGIGAGAIYAFRASGQTRHPAAFDAGKVLLDPYARRVETRVWSRAQATLPGDNVGRALRAKVVELGAYDWEGDTPIGRPLDETIIYELHVGWYTESPSAGVAQPGTFAGLREKIPYLVELGVTAVELMPVFQFDPTDGDYWGYNPIAHFAPHDRYGSVDDFRDLVKTLHSAGLEIILDVVFNHTGEAGYDGPTISLRGLDNASYYMISPRDRETLLDFSGCGNTLDVNDPIGAKLVFDCLRHWVEELHVDGFRFDLGSVLTRGPGGAVLANPPVVALAELADALGETKLIAEAWDAGGLYQVGAFPGRRWSEWNGRYRDDVRRFVRGDAGLVGAVATRIGGSSDLYQWSRRPPQTSVNFVTCHDGFTLRDLVSYDQKHNEANGEDNRDGSNDNLSWNCGAEGDTDDAAIEALRQRQARNFAVLLLVSQGVPMILAGDEAGRSQRGNNNAWNQANELSWLDWRTSASSVALRRFWRLLIAFRKRHPALSKRAFFDGSRNERGLLDVEWHGGLLGAPGWLDPTSRVLAFTLAGFDGDDDVHVIFNMDDQELDFELPAVEGRGWHRAFDTALPAPADARDPGAEAEVPDQQAYRAAARSAVVLVSAAV